MQAKPVQKDNQEVKEYIQKQVLQKMALRETAVLMLSHQAAVQITRDEKAVLQTLRVEMVQVAEGEKVVQMRRV